AASMLEIRAELERRPAPALAEAAVTVIARRGQIDADEPERLRAGRRRDRRQQRREGEEQTRDDPAHAPIVCPRRPRRRARRPRRRARRRWPGSTDRAAPGGRSRRASPRP